MEDYVGNISMWQSLLFDKISDFQREKLFIISAVKEPPFLLFNYSFFDSGNHATHQAAIKANSQKVNFVLLKSIAVYIFL